MSEALSCLNKYFYDSKNEVHYLGSDKVVKRFEKSLIEGEVIEFDAPDLYIKNEDTVWIIEHFEIDCYKANRKGSLYRVEKNRIERKEKEYIASQEGNLYIDSINAESSYDDYIHNVKRNFENHYKKIEKYKTNLIEKCVIDNKSDIIVLFIIEDVSPLGSTCIDTEGNWVPINLLLDKYFLRMLKKRKDLDCILFLSSCSNNKNRWFINIHEIDEYMKNSYDYNECKFVNMKPKVIHYLKEI